MLRAPYLIGTVTAGATVAVSTATAAGDAVFVSISASGAVTGLTDSQGNTYLQLSGDATNHVYLYAATYKGTAGTPTAALSTSDTITIAGATGNAVAGAATGLAPVAADKTPAFTSGSGTAITGPATGTLATFPELVIAATGEPSNAAVTWGGGFTSIGSALSTGNGATLAYKLVPSNLSVTPTATLGASSSWDAMTASFTPASVYLATVPTFPAGYGPLPADMNTWVRSNFQGLTSGVLFRGIMTTTQSLTAGSFNPLQLIATEDLFSGWSATSTSAQAAFSWLAPYTGWYEVTVEATTLAAALFLQAGVAISGGTARYPQNNRTPAGFPGGACATWLTYLTGGYDYVQGGLNPSAAVSTDVASAGFFPSVEIAYLSSG